MMTSYKANEDMFGEVVTDHGVLAIAQLPYIHGQHYQALAMDCDRNVYLVAWALLCPVDDLPEDESEACDWSTASFAEPVGSVEDYA